MSDELKDTIMRMFSPELILAEIIKRIDFLEERITELEERLDSQNE